MLPAVVHAQRDSLALAGLRWREIGPYRGGRSVAATGNPSRPDEFWMGTTGGGVFKSINAGQSWAPVSDKFFGGTIGAVAVAPSAPDVVYVGGGEYPIRGNVSHGDGVWKTTTAARHGHSSDSATRGRSPTSSCIPRIPISSTSARSATCGRRMPSAACFARRMAERAGKRSSLEMTQQVSSIWSW